MRVKRITKLDKIFSILSDLKWHCAKHELPGAQPGAMIHSLKQKGYKFSVKTLYCDICKGNETHRQLESTKASFQVIERATLPKPFRDRVRELYRNVEAVSGRKYDPNKLEVDHRFPFTRFSTSEDLNPYMDDAELRHRFQLLTRDNNLLKKSSCTHCKLTGERGVFCGINYFYFGGPEWDPTIEPDNERGCFGCFWYDPQTWKEQLNNHLAGNELSAKWQPGNMLVINRIVEPSKIETKQLSF